MEEKGKVKSGKGTHTAEVNSFFYRQYMNVEKNAKKQHVGQRNR